MNQTLENLQSNHWVQSPLWPQVKSLLDEINFSSLYLQRGTQEAFSRFEALEADHRRWISPLIDLKEFPYCYALQGATEGINQWCLTDQRSWQYLSGEYQWPQIIRRTGLMVEEAQLQADRVLYLSNPSCRDGNFLGPETICQVERAECPVILDCAYLGATLPHQITIPLRTEQIFFSFSKGWGLIGQRLGLAYTRKPHPTLKHMKNVECWNYQSVELIQRLIKRFSPTEMAERARPLQLEICQKLKMDPSDTYFIGLSESEEFSRLRRFGNRARICLTPLMQDHIQTIDP